MTIEWSYRNGYLTAPSKFITVPGATAVGLRNPNSSTNAIEIFKSRSLPAKFEFLPALQLGEIDCGFVIWYRSEKYGESIQKQLDESVKAYFNFVETLLDGGYPRVVITAATLPTIRDGQDWGGNRKSSQGSQSYSQRPNRFDDRLQCASCHEGKALWYPIYRHFRNDDRQINWVHWQKIPPS